MLTFIQGTEIERRMANYHFFSYNANEALCLTTDEKDTLSGLMANVRKELMRPRDDQQDSIVKDYIQLILDYCNRFYVRQFNDLTAAGSDLLSRFQQLLNDYYALGRQRHGLPTVKYCAAELCLSPGYFGDIIRNAMGEGPKEYIHSFLVIRAKNLLLSGRSIAQVADELGFEYPSHFTRLFKNVTGQTPSQFYASFRRSSSEE